MIAVVIKASGTLRQGDLVDTAGWRNASAMLRARHIRGAEASEVALLESGVKNIHGAAKRAKGDKKAT